MSSPKLGIVILGLKYPELVLDLDDFLIWDFLSLALNRPKIEEASTAS